jgi:predicted MPP superfamily phosphohydrolase
VLLLYLFSNPEKIRQARNYSSFYFVVSFAILILLPKFIFAVSTILSLIILWIGGKRASLIWLTGSFIICSGLFLSIANGIFFGRKNIRVEKVDLYFDNLPEQLNGIKLVQLSDIHLGSFGNDQTVIDQTVRIINEIEPDLMLFTGDLVNNFGVEVKGFESQLSQFKGEYGKYAIMGNHDYGDYSSWPDTIAKWKNLESIKNAMKNAGFKLLLNQSDKIQLKDTSFYIIGVENWGHKPFPQYANLDAAMKDVPANSFRILLSHDPAHWNSIVLPQTDIPLTLSGHTHGVQMGVKIAGIEFSPMYLIQKHWGGLYKADHQMLYVNRGLGTIGFKGRIDMRPEITLLTLYRSKTH